MVVCGTNTNSENKIQFDRRIIKVDSKKIKVEIAETRDQLVHGLMFRTELGQNEGMLFIFKTLKVHDFTMKNTFIDLSIGFFDQNFKLVDIQDMKASRTLVQKSFATYISAVPAQYALEMRRGWFKDNNIKLGSKLELHPSQ